MSRFKGTKGKWKVVESTCGLITETQCMNVRVGQDDIITVWDFSEESQANALLISKAPEMLDQLNRIHGEIMRSDGVLDVEKWGNQIEQLIKSATEL